MIGVTHRNGIRLECRHLVQSIRQLVFGCPLPELYDGVNVLDGALGDQLPLLPLVNTNVVLYTCADMTADVS